MSGKVWGWGAAEYWHRQGVTTWTRSGERTAGSTGLLWGSAYPIHVCMEVRMCGMPEGCARE